MTASQIGCARHCPAQEPNAIRVRFPGFVDCLAPRICSPGSDPVTQDASTGRRFDSDCPHHAFFGNRPLGELSCFQDLIPTSADLLWLSLPAFHDETACL